ncbi:MAG: hypothetical protein JWN56_1985 [Sphingobacteriales bacterium]|nr:hypothetical protein [Sphingobacteriales bacterium]
MGNLEHTFGEKNEKLDEKLLRDWQNKLLPWMIVMPTILISVFIYLATLQLNKFTTEINRPEVSDLDKVLTSPKDSTISYSLKSNMNYIKWITLAKIEEDAINKRYKQGSVLLMSRIYIKYLGFLTGMILAIVGSVFIISKIKEEGNDLQGTISEQLQFKILSSSPGIIFGLLGTCLMLSAILQHSEINIKDMPLYLNHYNILPMGGSEASPQKKSKIPMDSVYNDDSVPINE